MSGKKLLSAFIIFISFYNSTNAAAQNKVRVQLQKIAGTINARIGLSAVVIETGDTINFNSGQRFPMQSVYKFPIAMAILHKADQGKISLDQKVSISPAEIIQRGVSSIREKYPQGTVLTVNELLRLNLVESDGTACDVLIRLMGGTQKVQNYITGLGVENLIIATTEKVQVSDDWIQYQNWSTPAAMTALLKEFYSTNVLSEKNRKALLKWMEDSVPGNKRLKGSLPQGTVVAHKTGTSGTFNGFTRATNDVGIITLPDGNHLAISIFVSDAYGSMQEKEGIIAAMTKSIWDYYQ